MQNALAYYSTKLIAAVNFAPILDIGMEEKIMEEIRFTIEDMKERSEEGKLLLCGLDKYFDLVSSNIIKLFLCLDRVFVPVNLLWHSLLFAGKAKAYLSGTF